MAEYISEIHKILKLGGQSDGHFNDGPENLPMVQAENDGGSHMTHLPTPAGLSPASVGINPGLKIISLPRISFRSLIIYPVIFFVAFAFFYAALNFPSILAQMQGFFTPPQAQQILGSDSVAYYKWISNYFYAVNDPSLLSPTNDIDKDGLSNYDEFIMHTNPIVADSDNDGFSDGIEVINHTNPWGSGPMTADQKQLADKLDLTLINNRISFNSSPISSGLVAGTDTVKFDLDRAGTLSIPKLKLQVALIWSKDPSNFDADLTKGVIHYPGTALPGENGVIYVSGHSSDYLWKHDPMQDVFAKLNFLTAGDDVFVDVYGKDGKVYNFRYQVTGSNVYKPNDQAQFFDSSGASLLNLSTCWPIGTSTNRIVVSAVQVGL
jgi:LPXTG-site transpeptidase (sortase) family protein